MPAPTERSANELQAGLTAELRREVTAEDVRNFAELTGDLNPLHCDPVYAASTNYKSPIAHGAFQLSLCAALAGMQLPGRNCLITSIEAAFPSPLILPASVIVRAEVVAWNPSIIAGRLRLTLLDSLRGKTCCEAGIGFSMHEQRSGESPVDRKAPAPKINRSEVKPLVLVTGAAGGLGQLIAQQLLDDYTVLAPVNRTHLPNALTAAGAESFPADLTDPHVAGTIYQRLAGRNLYGVIHLAWPGLARGGLLNQSAQSLQSQVLAGTCQIVELARVLTQARADVGGRLISIGSVVGSHKPITQLAGYSLGKAALEHTTRLLAAELGIHKITANTVCPSLVPVGMNQQVDARRQKLESAAIPLGRLCTPDDVLAVVRWLLSPEASFVSGQTIGLSGGQL